MAPDGHGWWVYCVVSGVREPPAGIDGVAEGEAPRTIGSAGLAAVASRVPLTEFGEAPLRENLNDLTWLERTARGHEAVLEAMLAGGPVVPMSVCTIYRDEAQVREMLESRSPLFADALERLAGKAEWGVKIVADRAQVAEHARGHSDAARALAAEMEGKSEGGAYVVRKKLDALVRDETDRLLDTVVRGAHARLEEWAVGSVILPAQSRELAGYQGEMVFNGAYLVADGRSGSLSQVVGELGSDYGPLGFSFDLTGPWPAYNFAGAAPAHEVLA